ncbi:glycosyltransferase [Actinomycetospora flava]|uniref:Glycosyltransferase n=1 Tax=Actinomycetospora flava TaxID=3129232 RepID=A0ABU8M929_9PSEU
MPPGQELLHTARRDDADAALLATPGVAPFSWRRLLRALRDPDLEILEVAEPLWVGEWVRALRYIALAKAMRVVRRRRVAVATYAIENLDVRDRLRRPARLALGVSLLALDAVVFGTTGAAENYRRTFPRSLRRTRHTVLTPRLDECPVCPPREAPREPTVLFLGTPSERKGFGVLMRAWELSGAVSRGWRLVVADPSGSGEREPLPPGVSVTVDPPRSAVHEMLCAGAVVAMPSVRQPGWREQIGLPLVEGLTHGCRVVTTTETGLADDLREHPLVELTTPGDAASLADGLRRAMESTATAVPGRRGHTKSDVVAWWRAACALAR